VGPLSAPPATWVDLSSVSLGNTPGQDGLMADGHCLATCECNPSGSTGGGKIRLGS
jgi:hypothetical protein